MRIALEERLKSTSAPPESGVQAVEAGVQQPAEVVVHFALHRGRVASAIISD
jgi:hypothetical protein